MSEYERLYEEYRQELTREAALAFVNRPTVNPLTSAKIKPGRDRYNVLKDLCKELYGLDIVPPGERLPMRRLVAREPLFVESPPNPRPPPVLLNWYRQYKELPGDQFGALIDSWEARLDDMHDAFTADPEGTFLSRFELLDLQGTMRHIDLDSRTQWTVSQKSRRKLGALLRHANQINDVPDVPQGLVFFQRFAVRDPENPRDGIRRIISHVLNSLDMRAIMMDKNSRALAAAMDTTEPLHRVVPYVHVIERDDAQVLYLAIDEIAHVADAFHLFEKKDVQDVFVAVRARFSGALAQMQEKVHEWLMRNTEVIAAWEDVAETCERRYDGLECPVCWCEMEDHPPAEREKDRKICLHPCGHCVCLDCVRGMQQTKRVGRIACPTCQRVAHRMTHMPVRSASGQLKDCV